MSQVSIYIRNNLRLLSTSNFLALWERWNINFTTRRQLLKLSDAELRDIGIEWADAEIEGRKKFWQQ